LTLDAAFQETLPALLALLDVLPDDSPFLQLDPPQRRPRTFDALKLLLLRQSQVQPLLVVCEDLHWIDAETQALLDSLVETCPRLVCCSWSPTGRSNGRAGAARPTPRTCGSTRSLRPAPMLSSRPCWGMTPVLHHSHSC